jgi:hypothetical protein
MVKVPGDTTPAKEATPTSGLGALARDNKESFAAAPSPSKSAEVVRTAHAQVSPDEYAEAYKNSIDQGIDPDLALWTLQKGTGDQKRAADGTTGRFNELIQASETAAEWLGNPHNAAMSSDDADAMLQMHKGIQKVRPRGDWAEIGESTVNGFRGLAVSYFHVAAATGMMTPEEAAWGVSAWNQKIRQSAVAQEAETVAYKQRLDQAEGFGVIPAAFSDAGGFVQLVMESAGFSAPAIAGGLIAGPVAGLGILGAAGGAFVGGVASETGAWINSALAEGGYDLTDPESVLKAYRDPELMANVQEEGVLKGVTTSAVDALSMLLGGLILPPLAKGASLWRRAAHIAKELGVESVGESVGEGLGQIAATGQMDLGETLLEGVASLGQSGAQIATKRLLARMRPKVERVTKVAKAKQDAQGLREAATAFKESKTAKRAPEVFKAYVQKLLGIDEKAYFQRGSWDATWASLGEDPAEALLRIMPDDGRRLYIESEETGVIAIPSAELVEEMARLSDPEPLLKIARLDPTGVSLGEAEILDEESLEAELEDEVTRAGVLFQEERDLTEELTAIDEQLAGEPAKEAETDEDGNVIEDPATVELRERREAVKERLAELEQARKDDEAFALETEANIESALVEAGRPKDEAQAGAMIFGTFARVYARKLKVPIRAVADLINLRIQKAAQGQRVQQPEAEPEVAPEPSRDAEPIVKGAIPLHIADEISHRIDIIREQVEAGEVSEGVFDEIEKASQGGVNGDYGSMSPEARSVLAEEMRDAAKVSREAADGLARDDPEVRHSQKEARELEAFADDISQDEVAAEPEAEVAEEGAAEEPSTNVAPPQRAKPTKAKLIPTRAPDGGTEIRVEPVQEPSKVTPSQRLTNSIGLLISSTTKPIRFRAIQLLADKAYGGTLAEGAYTPQDVANAAELAVNKLVIENPDATVEQIGEWVQRLPTQTRRTDAKDKFQQFSTPQDYARVAVDVAGVTEADTVLEPSAGTGNLAAHAVAKGAKARPRPGVHRRRGAARRCPSAGRAPDSRRDEPAVQRRWQARRRTQPARRREPHQPSAQEA